MSSKSGAASSISDFGAGRNHTKQNYYINIDQELRVFEYALDGDTNGDYININTESAKRNAINTLLQHLDKKLMGGESVYKNIQTKPEEKTFFGAGALVGPRKLLPFSL